MNSGAKPPHNNPEPDDDQPPKKPDLKQPPDPSDYVGDVALYKPLTISSWLFNECFLHGWVTPRDVPPPKGAMAIIHRGVGEHITIPEPPMLIDEARAYAQMIGIPEEQWPDEIR